MRVLLIFLFAALSVSGFSQYRDLVRLKNGSAIRGEITRTDSSTTTLRTKDGSYWNFNNAEIDTIETFQTHVQTKGFYNRTSLGVLGGSSVSGSLRVVNGYSFNEHWETGLGLGIEPFYWTPYIPIFVEGRYSMFSGNTKPFVSANAGYEMPLRNFNFDKGGFSFGLDLGVSHYFTSHLGISTSIGYRFTSMKSENMWWEDFVTITQMNRFEIRLGLVFR